MKQNLEIEYKTMISENLFKNILEAMPFDNGVLQRNDYYDTSDGKLYAMGIMCRIRTIGNRYEFTVKIPQDEGVMEYEVLLEENSLKHPSIVNYFSAYDFEIDDLSCIAFSETLRYTYTDIYGSWCLDYSKFNHHSDYELEYELHGINEKAYPHYVDMLKSLKISYCKASPKYIRALTSTV